jgi:hypothetical protein
MRPPSVGQEDFTRKEEEDELIRSKGADLEEKDFKMASRFSNR